MVNFVLCPDDHGLLLCLNLMSAPKTIPEANIPKATTEDKATRAVISLLPTVRQAFNGERIGPAKLPNETEKKTHQNLLQLKPGLLFGHLGGEKTPNKEAAKSMSQQWRAPSSTDVGV